MQPGETTLQAAIRGLKEELSIEVRNENLLQLIKKFELQENVYEKQNIYDREFNECYKLIWNEEVTKFATDEISEIKWVTKQQLKQMVQQNPSSFTPWSLHDFKIAKYI